MNVDRYTVLSLGLTVLLVASTLPSGLAGLVGTASADHHDASVYTVRQPGTDRCYEIEPYSHDHDKMVPEVEKRGTNTIGDVTGPYRDPDWDGFESVESIMDYRYHDEGRGQTEYYAPYLNTQYMWENWDYGTYGLYNWSDNGDSHMFFYENPNGDVSLVVRHDRLNDMYATASHRPYNGSYGGIPGDGFHVASPGGGEVSWEFRNLPDGEWAYIDDMYPRQNMDDVYTDGDGTRYGHREAEYESEWLSNFTGGDFSINWYWGSNGTDGAAYRGFQNLAEGESVTIEPESFQNIDAWEVRNNTGHDDMDGEMLDLQMDRSVVIERGANCFSGSVETSRNTTEVGQSVTFSVDGSADQYQWDFDGDGTVEQNTTDGSATHAYETDGQKRATVTLVTSGQTQRASTTVEVLAAEPPTAGFAVTSDGDPDTHVAGETVTLNGSTSADNSGVIDSYEWSVDGTSMTGERAEHRFGSPGTYDVALTVTDPNGRNDTVTRTVTVVAQDDPNAVAQASPTRVEAGAPIPLDGSESSDGNGSVETYEWSTASGAGSVTEDEGGESTPGANVTFGSAGDYRVNLTVTDNNGNSDADSVAVTVTPGEAPVVEGTDVPSEVSVSGSLDVSASASDDSGRSLDYVWRFRQNGDAEDRTGRSASYEFDEVGDASVKLTVRDAAGRSNETDWIDVSVTARPSASLSVPDEADAGDSVTLDASGSSDADGGIDEYRWDFDGDGQIDQRGNSPTVNHEYGSADTYEPTVTVVDEDGQTASASDSIAVEESDSSQSGSGDSSGDRSALRDSGGGGSTSLGPPPVVTETETTGPNGALVDVRNARSDESIEADLPESDAAEETGVGFERLAVDLRDDDTHVAFESAAGPTAPDGVAALDTPDETLAYLDLGARYLDTAVANASVEFTVNRSALGELTAGDDVAVYRYDAGWQPVDATVVESSGESYRLRATADGLGTLAVGANRPLAVADAALGSETVATGSPVEVTATVENSGTAARSATVNLTLDGNPVAAETVEVPAGESTEVTLSGPAPAAGSYEVSVGGAAVGNLTVRETIPADTSVTGVSLNRSTIEAGERVEVTATVENAGGEPGERAVTLRMFGEAVATKNVTVPAGETGEVTFVRQVNAAGNYTVEVGDRTASLGVRSADGGLGSAAPDVPGFGVGAALAALLAATLLARLRG